MSRIFQIKRGNEADMPILQEGEPGFAIDTQKLFIGLGTENVLVTYGPVLHEVSLLSSNWEGSVAPYTQEVLVQGVTAKCLLVVSVKQQKDMIAVVSECSVIAVSQKENHVTFKAEKQKPNIDLKFQIVDWGNIKCL